MKAGTIFVISFVGWAYAVAFWVLLSEPATAPDAREVTIRCVDPQTCQVYTTAPGKQSCTSEPMPIDQALATTRNLLLSNLASP